MKTIKAVGWAIRESRPWAVLRRIKKKIFGGTYHRAPRVPQPEIERGRVIFTGFSTNGFAGHSKVRPVEFFPPFCSILAEQGIAARFVKTPLQLKKALTEESCVIHVYGEDHVRIDTPEVLAVQGAARLVFNDARLGPILARKDVSNRFLTEHGISMPSMKFNTGPVFSNSLMGTGTDVELLETGGLAKTDRYNTKFIDTRVRYKNRLYYTSVRLLSVGTEIVHSYVRVRDEAEGSPSVHNKDTPLDPEMVEDLQDSLVNARWTDLTMLAAQMGQALGPGFYAHDVLIDADDGDIFVCETGFKFDDASYVRHMLPIADRIPSQALMFTEQFAQKTALAFLSQCRMAGLFAWTEHEAGRLESRDKAVCTGG